jgi:predicted transcriptional regulator
MEYALLIIESFRYGIQNHIIPIIALLLSSKNEGVRSILSDDTSESRMILYNTIKNPHGDIIAFLHIYELLSETFIKNNIKLIELSHEKISYYISGEDNALTGSPMLYYDQLFKWCEEYGLNFYRMKDVIKNVLEITKTVKDKIGRHKIYVETDIYNKISGGTDEMYQTINHIFSTCYYKNKAGYIPEIKKYILLDSINTKYINIPQRSFILSDVPAEVIGYTDMVHVEMGGKLIAMFVCPFVVIP